MITLRRSGRGVCLWVAGVLAVLVCASPLLAAVGSSKAIEPVLQKKVVAFLADKGYGNISAVTGQEITIQNGHFLQLKGMDKTARKMYEIEIICSQDYSSWILLLFKERPELRSFTKQ